MVIFIDTATLLGAKNMDMDLTGPTWLKMGYRLCVLMAAYKTLVKYMGFYPDDIMMSVAIPALVLAIVLAVLWIPLNMIWILFWDVQEEFRAAPRLLASLAIGGVVFLMGTLFNWQLWTFPEEGGQLLILYWWDSVCAFCAMYALYCLHEYSVEGKDGETEFSTAIFTVLYLVGAVSAFLAGSLGFLYFSDLFLADQQYLFVFFAAVMLAYVALVLPYSLIRQSFVQWRYLKERTPDQKRVNYIVKLFKGYVPVFSAVISWFFGLWALGAGLLGDGGGDSSSSVIVLVNGVATGGLSGTGGAIVGLLAQALIFLIAAMLFMSASNAIAQWIVPLKKQKEISRQDDTGALSDRFFLITWAEAMSNPKERKTRFKVVASCVYVCLVLLSASSFGINQIFVALTSKF